MKKTIYKSLVCSAFFLLLVALLSPYATSKNTDWVMSKTNPKIVYLTFDDGPSRHTQSVLDILAQHNVLATFFVTGQNSDYFDKIKAQNKAHHSVAVHTYSHSFQEIYSSVDAYFKDVEKINDEIERQTGHRSNIIRFPGGSSNTVSRRYQAGIMQTLANELVTRGYTYYDWNASNGDGLSSLSADALVQTTIRESASLEDVTLLMHDGSCSGATVEALPRIIEHFKSQGYIFKPLDNSVEPIHHTIKN